MVTYKLNPDKAFALKIVDDISTGEWHNVETSEAYLDWLAEGNQPIPAEENT
jgi:hypothetical protein